MGTILTADAEFTNPGAELLLALVLVLLVRLTADEDAFRLALFESSPRRLAPTLPTVCRPWLRTTTVRTKREEGGKGAR